MTTITAMKQKGRSAARALLASPEKLRRAFLNGPQVRSEYRVVLIGDQGSGKTRFIYAVIDALSDSSGELHPGVSPALVEKPPIVGDDADAWHYALPDDGPRSERLASSPVVEREGRRRGGTPIIEYYPGRIRVDGRLLDLRIIDTPGGDLREDLAGDPDEWPEIFKKTSQADLLVLTLDPRTLSDERRLVLTIKRMLAHVAALKHRPGSMIAVVYSQCDVFGCESIGEPRILDGRAGQSVLFHRLRAATADRWNEVWSEFLEHIAETNRHAADVLRRTEALWRPLFLTYRRSFVAPYLCAAYPMEPGYGSWQARGVLQLWADATHHLRSWQVHSRWRPWVRVAYTAVLIGLGGLGFRLMGLL